ncbi:MAG: hypothetical protein QOG43_682 [Actinomycetota bacterium]|nr:hypothetical protein [Actinomycetota bacterium]
MRTLIVSEFVTLDGVMEAPGGEPTHRFTGWVGDYGSPELFRYKLAEVQAAAILLIGRLTYESFAGAWPSREGAFAERMNAMPKIVVSNTLTKPTWNNTAVLSGNFRAGIADIKAQAGGPIIVAGSSTLVHALLDADLVDELRLMVFPVTIGSGRRVFPATTRKTAWHLVESQTFPNQVRVDTYRPA